MYAVFLFKKVPLSKVYGSYKYTINPINIQPSNHVGDIASRMSRIVKNTHRDIFSDFLLNQPESD